MRVLRLLLLIFAVVSTIASVSARQSGSRVPATSDPQAVALLQKSLAALTGGTSITDVTLTGSAHRIAGSDDETGTATLEATSAGDSRVELSFASGNRVEIHNHSAMPLPGSLPKGIPVAAARVAQPVGEWMGPDGKAHAIALHNMMTDSAWFFPALVLPKMLAAQNFVFSYVGQETRNGQQVLHITAMQEFPLLANSSSPAVPGPALTSARFEPLMQHLSRMDFYLDPNSLLPIALDFTRHPDKNSLVDIAVEIRFLQFQVVNGVEVPMRIQKYLNNGLVLELQIADVTFNSGLSTSAFALR